MFQLPLLQMRWIFFTLLFAVSFGLLAEDQKEADYLVNFNLAKQHLSQRRIKEALPYLLYLEKRYPENANLKYLIGVCYTEEEIIHPKTIQLLSEATAKASLEYNPNSLTEERTPIYVFYYLSVAYAQHCLCSEAEETRNKFLEIYPHEDQYYVEESKKWLQNCRKAKVKPEQDSLPQFPNFKPYQSVAAETETQKSEYLDKRIKKPKVEVLEAHTSKQGKSSDDNILTKKIEYSTSFPLYGVQLGAFHEALPVSRFRELKNVDAFMDKDGLIRYVIGHFSIHSQAMSLLDVVKEKGYTDAFVVNVNDAKKFSEEVVSVNQINIRAKLKGKVSFSLQLGAFSESIPKNLTDVYFQIEGIQEHHQNGLTFITVGNFESYNDAKSYQSKVKLKGYKDAFVVAMHQGKKIPLQQALDFNP